MTLCCAIIGLPNVGKSTLFNALTRSDVPAEDYPFCTIEPHTGVVTIEDRRLQMLSENASSIKTIYSTMTFVDIAGLVKGASEGKGLGNKFLDNIRQEGDALAHVVKCFGDNDPIEDIEVIELELILADIESATSMIKKSKKEAARSKEGAERLELLKSCLEHLEKGHPIRSLSLDKESLKGLPFLTQKPLIYVMNVSEQDIAGNNKTELVKEHASKNGAEALTICAKMEYELAGLEEDEAVLYLKDVGLEESGLNRLAKSAFAALGLITFFTSGVQETKAWTITKGSTAKSAAGAIHSDIEDGFIKAEVLSYEDFHEYGSKQKAKEAGKVRIEGKNYLVEGGDIILFHHNR